MERLQLDPSALSDPGGAGADELIKLLARLSSQIQTFFQQATVLACPVSSFVTDLRQPDGAQGFASRMRSGDVVLFSLHSRDTNAFLCQFFFNSDGIMRVVLAKRLPEVGINKGLGGRFTWPCGINEIYRVLGISCLLESKYLAALAGKI